MTNPPSRPLAIVDGWSRADRLFDSSFPFYYPTASARMARRHCTLRPETAWDRRHGRLRVPSGG